MTQCRKHEAGEAGSLRASNCLVVFADGVADAKTQTNQPTLQQRREDGGQEAGQAANRSEP